MPESVVTVFLSATSADLASCREAAARVLRSAGIFPRIQEEFPADYRSLTEHLRALIAQCDAVICLVGEAFGAAPNGAGEPPRSYTQLEYDAARELGKPTFVYLTRDDYAPRVSVSEASELQGFQLRYRSELQQRQKCEWFGSPENLATQIALLVPRLRSAAPGKIFYRHVEEAPNHFVGRVIEMEQLRKALWQDSPSVVVVAGMGGQGKTTLVAEFLRTAEALPFANGFYCTGYRGAFSFSDFLDSAIDFFLGGQIDKRECKTPAARVSLLMEALQKRRLLIVLDGTERWLKGWNEGSADTAAGPAGEDRRGYFEGLDDFLRQSTGLSNGSHLLLTTRAIPAALDGRRLTIVPVYERNTGNMLRGLEPQDSELLLRGCGVDGVSEQIREAADQYNHHPLALTILGALLCDAYGGDITKWPLARAKGMEPRRAFDDLLTITRARLPGRDLADRFLQVASHAEEDPCLDVIAAAMNRPDQAKTYSGEDLREQAVALGKWQLVKWNGMRGTVSLHPIIRQYFAALVPWEESLAIHRRMAEWYVAQSLPPRPSSLDHARSRVLAILHFRRCGDGTSALSLFYSPIFENQPFADWLAAWGHQDKGVELVTELIESSAGFERANLLSCRGAFRRQLWQEQAARADLDQAIELLSVSPDLSSPERLLDLAGAYMNRANVGRELGALRDLDFYQKALDALAQIRDLRYLFVKAQETVQVRLNRANFLHEIGELSRGLADCDAAESLCLDLIADGSSDQKLLFAAALESRAIILSDLGRHDEALSCFSAALQPLQGLLQAGGVEVTPRIAHIGSMIGVALAEVGRIPEALRTLEESVGALLPMVEAGRKDITWQLALAYMNRSLVRIKNSDWADAAADAERAVSMFATLARQERRMAGWQGHALTLLAEARFHEGDLSGAQRVRDLGLQLLGEFLGQGQGGHAVMLSRSAATARYLVDSEPEEAVRILTTAVEVTEKALQWDVGSEALRLEGTRVLKALDEAGRSDVMGKLQARLHHCIRGQQGI